MMLHYAGRRLTAQMHNHNRKACSTFAPLCLCLEQVLNSLAQNALTLRRTAEVGRLQSQQESNLYNLHCQLSAFSAVQDLPLPEAIYLLPDFSAIHQIFLRLHTFCILSGLVSVSEASSGYRSAPLPAALCQDCQKTYLICTVTACRKDALINMLCRKFGTDRNFQKHI